MVHEQLLAAADERERYMMVKQVALVALLMLLCSFTAASGQSLNFSGYSWIVRDDTGGPGPNTFSPENVSVDAAGALHLKISKVGKGWTCAEIYTAQKFGYGTYEFTVETRLDHLDPNVVLGLFNYPVATSANDVVDGTNEIDIEYGRWAVPDGPNLAFTVYPSLKHHYQVTHPFMVHLPHPATLNRFIWSPGSVAFECLTDSGNAAHAVFAHWKTPESFSKLVSHVSMPVHLNLWIFQAKAPSDGQPVDIAIKHFAFAQLP